VTVGGIGVLVGVKTGVDVFVAGILVGVDVFVGGMLVGVDVTTGVDVVVAAGIPVDVDVTTGVDDPLMLTINLGELAPDSRDERLIAVEPGVVTPKLNVPSAVT
jgi:hypothetical protein